MPVKKRRAKKIIFRNIFVSVVVLLLIAGLILSAVLGFADFLAGGEESPAPPAGEDHLPRLMEAAALLEEALEAAPGDAGLSMQLADLYLELAMVHGSLGAAETMDEYVQKSEALLREAVFGQEEQRAVAVLRLAMIASYFKDDAARAEQYFREALALDAESAEGHLYYAIFLELNGRSADALAHFEKVLELEPAESELAALARTYLQRS